MKLPRDTALALLRQMIRIRRFEEKCAEVYSAGKIRGFLHLYIGEEAVATGVMPALTDEDAIVATYREHGHALARGISAESVMAEMYGKQEGCSRGRGGSMHLFDAGRRFYGGKPLGGGGLSGAAGMGAGLAHGRPLERGVADALDFVPRAIAAAPGLGAGHGPLNPCVPAPPRPPADGL